MKQISNEEIKQFIAALASLPPEHGPSHKALTARRMADEIATLRYQVDCLEQTKENCGGKLWGKSA